jgi:gas vesicle protein
MDDSGNRLSYFFLGLGVGVAVGLLFAPQSGEETRDLLRTKADDAKDRLKRKTYEWKDSAEEALSRGRETLRAQRDHLATAVDAGKQAYRDAVAGGEYSR